MGLLRVGVCAFLLVAIAHASYFDDSEEYGQYAGIKSTNCSCGYTYKSAGRIVNGKEAKVNEYPYMVGLAKKTKRGGYGLFCGASILTPYHVITAAHCTADIEGSDLAVLVGEHDILNARESKYTRLYPVAKKIDHEEYNNITTVNDISILVMAQRIAFNEAVGPICLPNRRINLVGQQVKVTGWGALSYEGDSSTVLMKVNLKVVSIESCQQKYRSSSIKTRNPTQFCTFKKNQDSCQGDSGGPLAWLDPETNRYTLVGLVSYGKGCASDYPGVNTDVYAFINWIQKQISANNPNKVSTCAKLG